MVTSHKEGFVLGGDERILITGATGFIGSRVVRKLTDLGFRNLRCFVRPSSCADKLETIAALGSNGARVEILKGNLLSREACDAAVCDTAVIIHLAAGRGEKSHPEAFRNSVVTTRNLLEAARKSGSLKRFVNVSSFSVYSNRQKPSGRLLDESCPLETRVEQLTDAYSFAKVKQDEIVAEFGRNFGVPYVIVRPGYVIGPGNPGISGRVGIGTFGLFLHLGGANRIPFTYVENCAEAIALAGVSLGIEGEVFNVVDDSLPSSRYFLRQYKRNVKSFPSLYLPHWASYAFCYLWEKYSSWSKRQLPPAFTRRLWHTYWKKTDYTNEKLKRRLGWLPKVPMAEALRFHFEACRADGNLA